MTTPAAEDRFRGRLFADMSRRLGPSRPLPEPIEIDWTDSEVRAAFGEEGSP